MNTMRLVFSLLVVSITVSSAQALEWVEYEGTIPENAVSVNEGTEDRPVCRKNSRIGIVNDAGKCYSVKVGGGVSKKTEDDGYQILVDNSETEIELAVAAATEGMVTQADFDAGLEEAVASATEGMVTQAEYDAVVEENTTLASENATIQEENDTALAGTDAGNCDSISPEAMQEALDSLTYSKFCDAGGDCIGKFERNRMISAIDEGISLTAADIVQNNKHIYGAGMAYPTASDYVNDSQWFSALKGADVHPFLAAYIAHINYLGRVNNSKWGNNCAWGQ